MSAISPQLQWRGFLCFLRDLGDRLLKSHRGSRRQFFCPARSPNLISFHEPHPGDTLHKGTLSDCLTDSGSVRMSLLNCLGGIEPIAGIRKDSGLPHAPVRLGRRCRAQQIERQRGS